MQKGIKILALAMLAALSLMAVIAAGAQAEGKLRVEGKVLASGEKAELEGEGGTGKILVPGLGLTIECKKWLLTSSGSNTNIGGIEHFHAEGAFLNHECIVVGNKFCTVYPTAADRTAKTNAGLLRVSGLLLELLAKFFGVTFHYARIQQLVGSTKLGTVFLGGPLCTLPAENDLTGSTAFKLSNVLNEEAEHELIDIIPEEESALGVAMKYGNEPATLDEGNGKVHLIGKFLGKKFSLD